MKGGGKGKTPAPPPPPRSAGRSETLKARVPYSQRQRPDTKESQAPVFAAPLMPSGLLTPTGPTFDPAVIEPGPAVHRALLLSETPRPAAAWASTLRKHLEALPQGTRPQIIVLPEGAILERGLCD